MATRIETVHGEMGQGVLRQSYRRTVVVGLLQIVWFLWFGVVTARTGSDRWNHRSPTLSVIRGLSLRGGTTPAR